MKVRKSFTWVLIVLIVVGYVVSVSSIFAGYNVSIEADGIALQGSRDAYAVTIKNIGSNAIESGEISIISIDGIYVTSDSKYQVSQNPQTINFLGAGDKDRIIFPLGVGNNIEPGVKIVKFQVIIDNETTEHEGTLEVTKLEDTVITSDSGIIVKSVTKTAPNQNMRIMVEIENPVESPFDLDRVSVELVGISSDSTYSDVTPVAELTAEEFKDSSFFCYIFGTTSIAELKNKNGDNISIEPGESSTVEFGLATGANVPQNTFYPVFKITFETPGMNSSAQTIEIKDPKNVTIDVGDVLWFKKPFRWFLDMLKETVGFKSYGIAIIILGILLKIVLIPLTNVQFKSMKKNAEVQPLIKQINEKYPGKENAQKRQEETMKTYKEHNVNLFAGCLPMLVQMPIIIALYTAINNYAPLNFASFLWMPSLGLPDPMWIMAILMAASTWFQQKVSQMPGQETNVAFQVIFPLFLGYIAFSFPTALTIYWVTFTFASIAHQMLFNKQAFGSYMLKPIKTTPTTIDAKGK